jgi:tRNA dimethylallyltransferase
MGGIHSLSTRRALFIVGPTASGKSALALTLAEKFNGEIISVDSMQVYRGLNIGTAKPTAEERARVPHHLIDVVELTEPFDAAKFCDLAARAENEIRARGKLPIFCGGTGFYFKAYLEGIGQAPPADERIRAELEQTSLAELLRELETKDPETFASIDRQNPRRVVRALEVIRVTGKPFSAQKSNWKPAGKNSTAGEIIGLNRERDDLTARINQRVDEMFRQGLVEETRDLLKAGLEENKTAMQAIGYRQAVEFLRGERSLEETIELIKIKTRQFAKRQMTWFRRQMQVRWIEISRGDDLQQIASRVLNS